MNLKAMIAVLAATVMAGCVSAPSKPQQTQGSRVQVTAEITNLKGTSGGSGVVIETGPGESKVLTNAHVCGILSHGGRVTTPVGSYLATAFYLAYEHDLCVITVAGDLKYSAKLADRAPRVMERISICGHPALLPNIITRGHVAGSQIIQILVGIRPCSSEEAADEKLGPLCLMAGGIPIIRDLEARVVSATIMPGSSGSPVFNSKGELAGLVFAGIGRELSYGITVPYEAVRNFLTNPELRGDLQGPGQSVDFTDNAGENKAALAMEKLQKACAGEDKKKLGNVCTLLENDMVWRGK